MNIQTTIGLCIKNASHTVNIAFNTITRQDYPHDLLKLVIVDNGSSDNTLSIAEQFAKTTDIPTIVLSNRNYGLSVSRQMVVDNAEGNYIVWIDDDYFLKEDFIRKQVEFMENNPQIGAARGLHIQNPISTLVGHLAIVGFILPSWNSLSPQSIGTGGAIFRIKAVKTVNGFDQKLEGAGEDVDITNRMRQAGWPLTTNPSVGVLKKRQGEATLRSFWRQQFWYGYGNHYLFHKFKSYRALVGFTPYAILYGFMTSKQIYVITREKSVFLLILLNPFQKVAQFNGFLKAHLKGYGHIKKTEFSV